MHYEESWGYEDDEDEIDWEDDDEQVVQECTEKLPIPKVELKQIGKKENQIATLTTKTSGFTTSEIFWFVFC